MIHLHDAIEAMCMHEITTGTQRSAGAMYGVAIINGVTADTVRCNRINKAIRKRWGDRDDGRGAVERVKKFGWDLVQALPAEPAPDGENDAPFDD